MPTTIGTTYFYRTVGYLTVCGFSRDTPNFMYIDGWLCLALGTLPVVRKRATVIEYSETPHVKDQYLSQKRRPLKERGPDV